MSESSNEWMEGDECVICGRAFAHRHTNLVWDDEWGLVQGPGDQIIEDSEGF